MTPALVLGVDVGAGKKGFDVVLLRGTELERPRRRQSLEEVLELAERHRPELVAIDSPCGWAPSGATRRQGEADLVRAQVCGIRWTPDETTAQAHRDRGSGYYDWIFAGLELYAGLDERGIRAIECFPTAAWSRWAGARGGEGRSQWTQAALATLGLTPVPPRTTQDERDAIAAAVTARQHLEAGTESFGEIVVPRYHPLPSLRRVAVASPAGEPVTSLAEWREHIEPAGGDGGWRRGRAAQETARAWLHGRAQQDVRDLLETRAEFEGIVFESITPGHRTSVDGGPNGRRRHDVLLVAAAGGEAVVIGVEARVDEAHELPSALAGTLAEARLRDARTAVLLVHELATAQADPEKMKANARALSDFLRTLGANGGVSGQNWLVGPFAAPGDERLPATLEVYVAKLRTEVR